MEKPRWWRSTLKVPFIINGCDAHGPLFDNDIFDNFPAWSLAGPPDHFKSRPFTFDNDNDHDAPVWLPSCNTFLAVGDSRPHMALIIIITS